MSGKQTYTNHSRAAKPNPGGELLKMSSGLRNALWSVLGISALSHLCLITGLWAYEGFNSRFDTVISFILIAAPLAVSMTIAIIYDTVGD
jgi:hypothetical protein